MSNEEKISRLNRALAETDAFIAKESVRRADLRPTEVQATLDFYILHRAKLEAMLGECSR